MDEKGFASWRKKFKRFGPHPARKREKFPQQLPSRSKFGPQSHPDFPLALAGIDR
jgi:hypothetical protein